MPLRSHSPPPMEAGPLPLRGVRVFALGSGITLLGVLRVLGADGAEVIPSTDADPLCRRSRWFRSPPPELGSIRPDSLAASLARVPDGMVLLPCSDAWARAVAALPETLRARFPASIASLEALEAVLDKTRLAETLERLGLPRPWTRPVESGSDLASVPPEILRRSFLKPAESQGFFARFGVKAFLASGVAELHDRLAECQRAACRMLLQEYVPGPPTNHFFIDGFVNREGEVRARFARRRTRMYPRDFGNSTLMVSIPVEEVRDAATTLDGLLEDVQYRGIFSAEFKRDERDGVAKLLEVNARPWWYVEFAARCGVDVCGMAVLDALGGPVPLVSRYAVGRRCVYPYYDFSAARAEWAEGRLGLLAWAASWLGAYQPVFRWSDPCPALGEVASLLRVKLS